MASVLNSLWRTIYVITSVDNTKLSYLQLYITADFDLRPKKKGKKGKYMINKNWRDARLHYTALNSHKQTLSQFNTESLKGKEKDAHVSLHDSEFIRINIVSGGSRQEVHSFALKPRNQCFSWNVYRFQRLQC